MLYYSYHRESTVREWVDLWSVQYKVWQTWRRVKTRQAHTCAVCAGDIAAGDDAWRPHLGKCRARWHRICTGCVMAAENGVSLRTLWDKGQMKKDGEL